MDRKRMWTVYSVSTSLDEVGEVGEWRLPRQQSSQRTPQESVDARRLRFGSVYHSYPSRVYSICPQYVDSQSSARLLITRSIFSTPVLSVL